ncbi:hypothetical protein Zmor_018918 [Zophobas morio]|uniref:RNA-directed DNA polymerase from mobile element jockey n=1 Tax=Zophobas morio TaxID=2755281 RepID=A0AA38IBB7_9CUCU|nr:hypothetical protein Zmor_018918 [Zophobas morio]
MQHTFSSNPPCGYMTIVHSNIRSAVNKVPDLRDFVSSNALGVVALTETWLNPLIDDKLLHINKFTFVREDRETRGGGVAIYIPSHLKHRKIDIPLDDSFNT